MNQKEIKELIEFLVEKDIAEFSLERGDMKVHIKRGAGAAALPKGLVPQAAGPAGPASADGPSVAAPAAPPPSASATGAAAEENLFIVKSPVSEGQVLCLIEAMKLMNEIEAEVSGEIAKQFVSNGSPVEYGMPLFGIRRT